MTTPQLTARLRGGGCGVLVGALAVAAHGIAGGGVPGSAEFALLLLVALAAGAFAVGPGDAAVPHRTSLGVCARTTETVAGPATRPLLALIGGQWAGHFALAGSLDHHGGLDAILHLPDIPMIAAHLLAAFACAALILVAERLYLLASGAIRALLGAPRAMAIGGARRRPPVLAAAVGSNPFLAHGPRAPPLPF
ncbi:hypothetical protein [Nocardia rhizosphaerae]|uniref:Uncharacterized protein n=1 Tax=Nocardia rhizosphaerae TaxID=1691571 RepID=A0ABV8L0E7_9NOCA